MRTMISYSSHPQSRSRRARTPTQTMASPTRINNNINNVDNDIDAIVADHEDRQSPAATPTKVPRVVTPRPLSPSEQTTASGASSHYSQTKKKMTKGNNYQGGSGSGGFFPSKIDQQQQQQQLAMVRQQQQQQQRRQDSYDQPESVSVYSTPSKKTNTTNSTTSTNSEPVDMTNLLKHIERREWMQVVKFFEKYPHAPQQKAPNSGNLPLHEALKHNPPLPVVNLLLEMHEGALRTTGAHEYLPLHVACNCRHIGVDVVTRLVVGHAAALRTREPTRDGLPLHLAVQTGVSEEVLMELLTNYPEASFVQDNSGKIPLDYAQESVHHHNRSIVALETAPILLAAAQAAQSRVSKELEFKMNGLREAHKEYVRQLEERFEEERASFLQDQIHFSNELAHEKERNISLAEMLMDAKTSEKNFAAQRDQLQVQLDRGMKEFRTMIETQEAELRLVLDEADLSEPHNGTSTDRALPGENYLADTSLKGTLTSITKEFNASKSENAALHADLMRQQEMVRHLNELLTSKDDEMTALKEKLSQLEVSNKVSTERAKQLSDTHTATVKDLSCLREEMEELRLLSNNNQDQLQKYKRTVEIQGTRLGTVKNLVATLNFNMESWEKEDKGREQERGSGTKGLKEVDDPSTACNSTLSDEVNLSNDSSNLLAGTTVVVTKVKEENAVDDVENPMDEAISDDDLNSVPTEVEKQEIEDEVSRAMTSEDSTSEEAATGGAAEQSFVLSDSELANGEVEV